MYGVVLRGNTHSQGEVEMQKKSAVFVVLAGPGFAVMDKIYEAAPKRLKARFGDKDIRYPGTPFKDRNPPFLWTPDEQRIVPLARLHYYWGDIAQYNATSLEGDLESDMVVGLRYGFDAACSATADSPTAQARKGINRQHHSNVGITLPFQNIIRPFYVLPQGTRKQLVEALAKRYRKLDEKILVRYVDHFIEFQGEYFEGTGQNPPLYVDLSRSCEQMYDDFVDIVGNLFELYKK